MGETIAVDLHFVDSVFWSLNLSNDCQPSGCADPSFQSQLVTHLSGVLRQTDRQLRGRESDAHELTLRKRVPVAMRKGEPEPGEKIGESPDTNHKSTSRGKHTLCLAVNFELDRNEKWSFCLRTGMRCYAESPLMRTSGRGGGMHAVVSRDDRVLL